MSVFLGYLAGLVFIWFYAARHEERGALTMLATILYPFALLIWAAFNARAAWYRAKDWIRDHI